MTFGIMQGRLSPLSQGEKPGTLQFFPKDWQHEFDLAKEIGFECIEWIFDHSVVENPMFQSDSIPEIVAHVERTGIPVNSICADYFMREVGHLNRINPLSALTLRSLIRHASAAGVSTIGIPFVEEHSLELREQREALYDNLAWITQVLDEYDVDLAFEVDTSADLILEVVDRFDSPRVGVCYDTGNATTFDRDLPRDIRTLGKHLKEVHIKDRIGGTRTSVRLGKGNANLFGSLQALAEVGFKGPCILQAWRSDDAYLDDAKQQLAYMRELEHKL